MPEPAMIVGQRAVFTSTRRLTEDCPRCHAKAGQPCKWRIKDAWCVLRVAPAAPVVVHCHALFPSPSLYLACELPKDHPGVMHEGRTETCRVRWESPESTELTPFEEAWREFLAGARRANRHLLETQLLAVLSQPAPASYEPEPFEHEE